PNMRTKCINPENVAALVALVKAPASSPSKTILLTKPMYAPASPTASRSSTILKLLPDHELSRCAQIQQATATIVSPSATAKRKVVWITITATSHTTANIGSATQASAWPV